MDLEGTEICDWLTTRGITCVLLKYRLPGSAKLPKSGGYPQAPQALDDAQRTISLTGFMLLSGVDPRKIGVIGLGVDALRAAKTAEAAEAAARASQVTVKFGAGKPSLTMPG